MPRYDFTCTSCGKAEERVLMLSEHDKPQACSCGGVLEKGWTGTAPGVVFKGRGWTPKHYNTNPRGRR